MSRKYYAHHKAIVDTDDQGFDECEIGEGTKIWAFSHV